jgi:hypothetical protein
MRVDLDGVRVHLTGPRVRVAPEFAWRPRKGFELGVQLGVGVDVLIVASEATSEIAEAHARQVDATPTLDMTVTPWLVRGRSNDRLRLGLGLGVEVALDRVRFYTSGSSQAFEPWPVRIVGALRLGWGR